jgi:ABC-type glutathione transport system ATPase component
VTSIVSVQSVCKDYGSARRGTLQRVVDDVSFEVERGQTFGIVGESGSGKTTMARMLLRLTTPTAGQILVDGLDVARASRAERVRLRRTIQIVFQDPASSMNPRLRIRRILAEGIRRVHSQADVPAEVERLLEMVGIPSRYANLLPHELSGGQRQRVAVARALSVGPTVLVADEPVSALDVSLRGQVLNLLTQLREELDFTCIFIAHDLGVVRQFCDEVIVMKLGKVVERGESERVFSSPQHAYTRQLVASIPRVPS